MCIVRVQYPCFLLNDFDFSPENDLVVLQVVKQLWNWALSFILHNPSTALVLCTVIHRDGPKVYVDKVEKFRSEMIKKKHEAPTPSLRVFDCYPLFNANDLSDGLHLTKEASERLSELFAVIVKHLLEPRNIACPPYLL